MTGLITLFSPLYVVGATSHARIGTGQITFQDLWVWIARLLNLAYKPIYPHLRLAFWIKFVNEQAPRIRLQTFIRSFFDTREIKIPLGFIVEEKDDPEPNYDEVVGDDRG